MSNMWFFGLALLVASILFTCAYLRVSGDLQVCREYYPRMGTAACYFSSKTVRTPE